MDTGRFLWQSNGDTVEEAIFSDNCAQPACTSCISTSYTQSSRFAWPYIATKAWPYYPYGPIVACGASGLTDSSWDIMSRGYSNTVNYGGQGTYNGGFTSTLTFKGIPNYPLAIVAPDKAYHHSSRLQIYTR